MFRIVKISRLIEGEIDGWRHLYDVSKRIDIKNIYKHPSHGKLTPKSLSYNRVFSLSSDCYEVHELVSMIL